MLAIIKKHKGFSLIELAMVLFIVGLLLGGLLIPLSTSIEQQNRESAEVQLTQIRDALLGFTIINGRLPCPDCPDTVTGTCNAIAAALVNDGQEDLSGTAPNRVCHTNVGNVPWVDLQVDEDDPWGNHFTYQPSVAFSRESNTAVCGTAAIGVSFELCTAADVDLYTTYADPYSGTPDVADNVVAVVVSHGSNHLETAQADQEVENYGRNPVNPDTATAILASYTASDYDANVFILSDYDQDANGDIEYDDLLIWIPSTVLMNKMVSAGRLP